jgi:hypothetical protein
MGYFTWSKHSSLLAHKETSTMKRIAFALATILYFAWRQAKQRRDIADGLDEVIDFMRGDF